MLTKIDVIEYLIENGPDRTEIELSKALYGPTGYQQQVNQECSMLVSSGRVKRRGAGGVNDPFRYFPKS